MTTPSASPSPAVLRAARVLRLLAGNGEPRSLTLSQLARELDCAKSSAANICAALIETKLVARSDSNGEFRLDRATLELGGAYLATADPVREFYNHIADFPTARQETIQLAFLDGTQVMYLGRHDGQQPIKIWSSTGRRLPASCTATGKVLLAALDDDEVRQRYSDTDLPRPTDRSIATIDALLADLAQIRARGYAIDDEEATRGVVCIGVAAPQPTIGDLPLALSATMVKGRDTDQLREALLEDLHAFAHRFTNQLDVSRSRA